MVKDEIIRMAKDAGFHIGARRMFTARDIDIERFANLVAAAEREACAKLMDEMNAKDRLSNYYKVAANAIRERGNND